MSPMAGITALSIFLGLSPSMTGLSTREPTVLIAAGFLSPPAAPRFAFRRLVTVPMGWKYGLWHHLGEIDGITCIPRLPWIYRVRSSVGWASEGWVTLGWSSLLLGVGWRLISTHPSSRAPRSRGSAVGTGRSVDGEDSGVLERVFIYKGIFCI